MFGIFCWSYLLIPARCWGTDLGAYGTVDMVLVFLELGILTKLPVVRVWDVAGCSRMSTSTAISRESRPMSAACTGQVHAGVLVKVARPIQHGPPRPAGYVWYTVCIPVWNPLFSYRGVRFVWLKTKNSKLVLQEALKVQQHVYRSVETVQSGSGHDASLKQSWGLIADIPLATRTRQYRSLFARRDSEYRCPSESAGTWLRWIRVCLLKGFFLSKSWLGADQMTRKM